MTKILTRLLFAGVALLMSVSVVLAEECDESSDCPEGKVCNFGECLVVPAECATFCENFSPCFSGGGVECTGVGMINDAGELVDVVEECHPYEGTKDLLDDCLGDCASAMQDDEGQAMMTALMNCLEEADYDCGAEDMCGEQAGMGGSSMGDDDVVSTSGGEEDGQEAPLAEVGDSSSESGGSGSSCSASGRTQNPGSHVFLLLCIACMVLLRRRRRVFTSALRSG